jgi:flagellar M-ring protein FliF
MAGLGLPKTGRIGFEIFDKTNFGITDFAEHVNYRRALEGELERSVMAISDVQQARVHVTLPKDSVFTDAREAAKASVLVGLRPWDQIVAGRM